MIARSILCTLLLMNLSCSQICASEKDALFKAIDLGDCDTIKQLVRNGICLDTLRYKGHSVLSYAVQRVGQNCIDTKVIEELVECGAPVNVQDEDEIRIVGHQRGVSHTTPLHYVARLSNQQAKDQLWKLFIAKGANIHALDAQGQSPEILKQALMPYSSELHQVLSKALEDEIFNS